MAKATICKFKKFVVFVLIVTMVTPTIVLGTDQPWDNSPWENLPVIEPFYIDPHMREFDFSIPEEQFLEVECTEVYDLLEQARIDELLEEQRNMWRQDPYVQEAYRFYELANSPGAFSSLNEDDRNFILRKLNIDERAYRVTTDLLAMMERNGHTLSASIDLLIVMSSGLFAYEEAKTLIANIPNTIERNTEIMRFEQFVRGFGTPSVINTRRLICNRPLNPAVDGEEVECLRVFADINSFISPGVTDANYSFMEHVEVILADMGYSSGRSYGVGLENTRRTQPWVNQSDETPEYIATRYAINAAFTNESAFNVAMQMFLDNRGVAEIETAFALGAALQVEPETFLLPANMYRAESAVLFADNGGDSIQAVAAFSAGVNDLEPTPQPPTPPNAVHDTPSVMEHPFDAAQIMHEIGADAEELDYLIEYGIEIVGFGITLIPPMPISFTREQIVSNPFGLNYSIHDSVDLNTGAALYRTNVLSLPGRGGFGFSLDLVYNSADADLSTPSHTTHADWYRRCPRIAQDVLALAFELWYWHSDYEVTWIFVCYWCRYDLCFLHNPPVPERMFARFRNWNNPRQPSNNLGVGWRFDLPHVRDNALHIPGRGSFALYHNQIDTVLHTLQDIQLVNDTSFTSGSHTSSRRATFHDGTSYFFMHDWHIIGKRDRFGNTISFQYTWQNGQFALQTITDSNNKQINFQYQGVGDNRTITIIGPDNSSYTINLSRMVNVLGHTHAHNLFQLNSVQNQVGAVTSFTYDTGAFYYNFGAFGEVRALHQVGNHTLLLRRVNYPSGAQLRFNYGWRETHLGPYGSRQTYFVTSRYLFNNNRAYHHATFNPQGLPTPLWIHVGRPPWHRYHTYSTTVTQNNGLRTVYTFNYRHLNTQQRTYNSANTLLSQQTIAYNNDRLPTSITLTEHNNGFTRTNTQRFYYNQFGQVTTAVNPLAQGSTHARYRTVTTYDNRFGLPGTVTFMPDNNTTIREANDFSPDGRRIIRTHVYENNVLRSRTEFLHDTHGNVTEIREFPNATGSEFVTTQITYDRGTMPTSILTLNVRDANNALLGGTGIVERRFTYDAMWRVLSETDPMGYVTSWQYDRIGRVTRVTHPNGGFETYTYNDTQNRLTHRTVLGATYTHQFDSIGNLLTITDPSNTVILRNIYDNRMRLTETQNAQGIASSQRTTLIYDIFDRVTDTRRLNAAGGIMYRETTVFRDIHDVAGNSRIETTIHGAGDAPSIVNFAEHDRFGRLTQEGTVGGGVITYTHDLAGRVVTEQSLGIHNTFTYNIFGVTSVRNIEGNTLHNTYDSMGRLLTSSDFMGNVQRFTYDALGQLIRQDVPFERTGTITRYTTTLYFYDRNGSLTQSHQAINTPGALATWSVTTNTFRHNRLMSSRTGNGPLTEYTYDLAGNVLTKRVGGATTTFTYNNRGQLTRTADALGQEETFTYDANGLLLTRTDRNGTLFRMTYDNMGRLIREEAVQNGVVTGHRAYTFANTGALLARNNGSHIHLYTYDAQGRMIGRMDTAVNGIWEFFFYNAANNITEEWIYAFPRRYILNTYTFDTAQRIRTVTSNGQLQSSYAYDANGNRTNTTLSNGVTTEYARNLAGLVTRLVNRRGTTVLSQFDYIYYLDGNTHRVVETIGGVTRTINYIYDTARRLTRERDTGTDGEETSRAYTFDNRGNRTHMTVTGAETYTITSTHDLNNRLLTETRTGSGAQAVTFTHDRNGNQLTRTVQCQALPVHTVIFHFDDTTVEASVQPGQPINPALIPVPVTRYSLPGIPAQALMGWYTEIFDRMHLLSNPNRAIAVNLTQPLTTASPDGILHLHGSWLQYGDVNGDGSVDVIDSSDLMRYVARFPGVNIIRRVADVNMDGSIDALDVNQIHRFVDRHPITLGPVSPFAPMTDVIANDEIGRGIDLAELDLPDRILFEFTMYVIRLILEIAEDGYVSVQELTSFKNTIIEMLAELYAYNEEVDYLPDMLQNAANELASATAGQPVDTLINLSDMAFLHNYIYGVPVEEPEPEYAGVAVAAMGLAGVEAFGSGGDTVETRTYNAFNQLIRFENADTIATYTYRADGLRHSKTVNGVETTHVWSRGQIVLERNAAGAVINRYIRCLRGRLIRSDHHGFYLYNVRGDVVQRTDASGNVIGVYRYSAFGVELTPNASNTNRFRFAGEYWDAHRGEYYLRARSFNPRTGRFSQEDPHWGLHNMIFGDELRKMNERHDRMGRHLFTVAPDVWAITQAGNLFMYCMHNPVAFTDASGLKVNPIGIIIGLGGGAALGVMVADYLGYTGWRRTGIIAGFTVGGAIIGNFAPGMVNMLATRVAVTMGIAISGVTVRFGEAILKYGGKKRDMLLNTAHHQKLRDIINSAYVKSATTGDGGTADMLRHEFTQGLTPRHLQKANDLIIRLNNFILDNVGRLEINDLFIAEQMKRDLNAAINLFP